MKIFKSIPAWRVFRSSFSAPWGFVPTMGALHRGHLSLVQHSLADNPYTAASIYVNPTQFDQQSDLEKYPRTLENDLDMLRDAGVDAVLLPTYSMLYPDNYRYHLSETGLSQQFCGAHRLGHFDGVLTVVMKLLHLVTPQRAYFGKKDYQQLTLVRGMVEAFLMPVEIIACPTVREADGLALSSRNQRLSPQQRLVASKLFQIISQAADCASAKTQLMQAGFDVDYVEEFAGRRLAAASLGEVRLIDNVPIGIES